MPEQRLGVKLRAPQSRGMPAGFLRSVELICISTIYPCGRTEPGSRNAADDGTTAPPEMTRANNPYGVSWLSKPLHCLG